MDSGPITSYYSVAEYSISTAVAGRKITDWYAAQLLGRPGWTKTGYTTDRCMTGFKSKSGAFVVVQAECAQGSGFADKYFLQLSYKG